MREVPTTSKPPDYDWPNDPKARDELARIESGDLRPPGGYLWTGWSPPKQEKPNEGLTKKKATDATGAPIDPAAIYVVVMPYSSPHGTYNVESRMRGDSEAVLAHPAFWMPEGLDSEAQHRLRVMASMPPVYDHSPPRSKPIPLDRQAIAVDSFTAGADYIHKGQVVDVDDPRVRRYPELFRRAPQPIEPREAA